MSTPDDQRIFTCTLHNFTTVASASRGELSCRGSAGTRFPNCVTCDQAVADAFAYVNGEEG